MNECLRKNDSKKKRKKTNKKNMTDEKMKTKLKKERY